jgi:hypothetical protein
MLTLSEIEIKVYELAQKIGAPQNTLPTYGFSEQTDRPHVEISSLTYSYVVAQSGQEVSRYATRDIDQLLYKILVDVTFGLAVSYAEKKPHRESRYSQSSLSTPGRIAYPALSTMGCEDFSRTSTNTQAGSVR